MRQVVTSKDIELMKINLSIKEQEVVKPDEYVDRLIKYIPSEVIALYITLSGIATAAANQIAFKPILWIIFIIGIIGTILYLWRIAKVTNYKQIAISTIAFIVWVFALGGPFETFSWYNHVYGALILPIYTFFIPIITTK